MKLLLEVCSGYESEVMPKDPNAVAGRQWLVPLHLVFVEFYVAPSRFECPHGRRQIDGTALDDRGGIGRAWDRDVVASRADAESK